MLNRAVVKKFWIMDEDLHTVELTPEFAALQEHLTEVAGTIPGATWSVKHDDTSITLPMPRSELRRPQTD